MVFNLRYDENGDIKVTNWDSAKKTIKDFWDSMKVTQQFKDLGILGITETDVALLEKFQNQLDVTNKKFEGKSSLTKEINKTTEAFINSHSDMSQATKNAANALGKEEISLDGIKKGLKATNTAARLTSIGFNLLSTAANMAITMLASWAISVFIDKFVNAGERMRQSAEEAANAFSEAQKNFKTYKETISEVSQEYATLAKGVDIYGRNISLNTEEYERYNEITNQIAEMFPSLIQGYTDEGNAIIKHKGNVEELTRAYEKYVIAQHQALDAKGSDIWGDFSNQTNEKSDSLPWEDNSAVDVVNVGNILKDFIMSSNINEIAAKSLSDADKLLYVYNKIATLSDKSYGITTRIVGNLGIDTEDLTTILNGDIKVRSEYINTITSAISEYQSKIDEQENSLSSLVKSHYKAGHTDYAQLSEEAQSIADAVISSFDFNFYKEQDFNDIEEVYSWFTTNVINPLKSTELSAQINLGFNAQTKFNNDEITVGEYQQQIENLMPLLESLDDDVVKSIRILFGVEGEDTSTIEKAINRLTQNGVNENVAKEFVSGLNLSDLDKILTQEFDKAIAKSVPKTAEELNKIFSDYVISIPASFEIDDYKEQIDALQEQMTSLQSAIKSIEEGNLTPSDAIDLAQKFPELWPYINDLEALKSKLEELEDSKPDALITTLTDFRDTANLTAEQKEQIDALITSLNALKNSSVKADTLVTVDSLLSDIEGISSAYKTVFSSIKEYNESGILSIDTFKSLVSLEPKYIDCLVTENGQLQLNTASYVELTKAQLENLKVQKALETIKTLNALQTVEEANKYASSLTMQATETLSDMLDGEWQNAIEQAYLKDLANGTTAFTDAVKAGFISQQKYNAIIDATSQSLDKNADATYGATDALESQKKALEECKQQQEKYKQSLEDDKSAIEDLIDLTKEYIKQLKEDEKDALEENKKQMQDRIDSEIEYIDLLEEELDKAKEKADFEKSLSQKQNSLASANLARISASLDDSAVGKRNQKEAQDNYESAKSDVDDLLAEHAYDVQKEELALRRQELEDYKTEQEAYYDDLIQKIDDYLSNEVQLYRDACALIDSDNGTLYQNLLSYVQTYTTKTNAEFNHLWTSAKDVLDEYNNLHLTTFELLNYLQGNIYAAEATIEDYANKIDEVGQAIGGVAGNISSVSSQINDTTTAMSNNADILKKWADTYDYFTSKFNGYWAEYIIDGQKKFFSSKLSDKKAAAQDIAGQISAQLPGYIDIPWAAVYGTLKKYASGTKSARGGLSIVDEQGIGTELIPTPIGGGRYTILPQGNPVFSKAMTNELFDFASNPSQYLSDISAQIADIPNNVVTNNQVANTISPIVNINIQGDATSSTVRALRQEADNIVKRATEASLRNIINTVDRNNYRNR